MSAAHPPYLLHHNYLTFRPGDRLTLPVNAGPNLRRLSVAEVVESRPDMMVRDRWLIRVAPVGGGRVRTLRVDTRLGRISVQPY